MHAGIYDIQPPNGALWAVPLSERGKGDPFLAHFWSTPTWREAYREHTGNLVCRTCGEANKTNLATWTGTVRVVAMYWPHCHKPAKPLLVPLRYHFSCYSDSFLSEKIQISNRKSTQKCYLSHLGKNGSVSQTRRLSIGPSLAALDAAIARAPQTAHCFHPAENLFHPFT